MGDPGRLGDQPPFIKDFAKIWRAASKIVYSSTLDAVSSERTRIEWDFYPAAIRRMKEEAVGDIAWVASVDRQAISAGLVDEYQLFVAPTWLEAALDRSPMRFGSTSTWWMSAASTTAWCI